MSGGLIRELCMLYVRLIYTAIREDNVMLYWMPGGVRYDFFEQLQRILVV